MTTKAQTVAGSTLGISASAPATQDVSGFAALVYTTIAEITDFGGLGIVYTEVTHNGVSDRTTYKFKGSKNYGSMSLKMAKATLTNADAGQTLLQAAVASDADYSYVITFQDASNMYFQAKALSFQTNVGSVNNILTADCNLTLTSPTFESV